MKRTVLVYLTLLMLAVASCRGGGGKSALRVYDVGKEAVQFKPFEQESQNIPYWVENGARDRVLVRFSAYDGLEPVDDASLKEGALYSSDNLVYVAHRLGIIREAYWVTPTFGSVTEEDLGRLRDSLKKKYPGDAADIDGIKLNGGVASGTVNGVPVKIAGLQDLPKIDEPVLMDTDVSYLSSLYISERETRILPLMEGFFKLVAGVKLRSDLMTISASSEDGKAPLKFRFLVKYISTLFAHPDMVDADPPRQWAERAEVWRVEQDNPKAAIPLYEGIVRQFPDDAASRYDLAEAYFRLGDLNKCADSLSEAVRLDAGYKTGYGVFAARLKAAGKADKAKEFAAAQTAR